MRVVDPIHLDRVFCDIWVVSDRFQIANCRNATISQAALPADLPADFLGFSFRPAGYRPKTGTQRDAK